MTNDITELLVMIVGDIPDRLHLALTKFPPGSKVNQTPPKQPAVMVSLPIRVSLVRHPGNKILASAEKKQPLLLTPHEAQTIETFITHHQLSKEAALKELIQKCLQDHELLREVTTQVRRNPSKQTQVEVEIALWGPMSWDEKRTDNTTS